MGSSLQGPRTRGAPGKPSRAQRPRAVVLPGGNSSRPSRAGRGASIPNLVDGAACRPIVANQTKDGIILADGRAHRIVDVNASALHLLGYERDELIGAPLSKLVASEHRGTQRARIAAAPREASLISQACYRRKDGSLIDVEIEQRRLEDGRILGVVRSASQSGLAAGQFSQMLTRFDLFVTTVDRDGRISYANPALSALTGWSVDELIGRSAYDLLPAGFAPRQNQPLSDEFLVGELQHPVTTEIVTRSGAHRWVVVSATLLLDEAGALLGAAIFGQDIILERAAHTELVAELRERAGVATAIARLGPGGTTEATARAICKELRGLRGADLAAVMVFSTGGEVTVLASDAPAGIRWEVAAPPLAARSAYLVERAAKGPWVELWKQEAQEGDHGTPLTRAGLHSVSYAPIRYGDSTLGLLVVGSLQHADPDFTIYGVPVIAEFGPAASALLAVDLHADRLVDQLRGRLQAIVSTRAFHPVFQPIVEVDTGQVVGYEALTRFADGEPPDARFSSAWAVGSGVELELATLDRAIRAGRDLPIGRWLSVNISPGLLTHIAELQAILDVANRPLVLEITEHEVISDYRAVREALHRLSPSRIAVDDAGAGIANFAHIVDLQADFVKVDTGLVRSVDTDPARQAMIMALSHFARATGCQLIAEGVETRGEAQTLMSLGVGFGQGYWYGRPLPVDALIAAPKAELVPAGR